MRGARVWGARSGDTAVWASVEQVVTSGGTLVVDLADASFIDSSGLSVLIRAHQVLGPGGSLVVRSPTAQARRLFHMAGIEQLLTIDP